MTREGRFILKKSDAKTLWALVTDGGQGRVLELTRETAGTTEIEKREVAGLPRQSAQGAFAGCNGGNVAADLLQAERESRANVFLVVDDENAEADGGLTS